MARFPPDFQEQYETKRESFHAIAETIIANHGKQLTADEIAEQVDPEREGVQNHLRTLEEDGWVQTNDGPKAYTWDTQKYNPAEYEGHVAVNSITDEALGIAKRATNSGPELLAFATVVGLATGIVLTISAAGAILLPIGTDTSTTFGIIGMGYALGSIFTLTMVEASARLHRWLS